MARSSGGPPARRFFVGISSLRGRTTEDRNLIELLDPVAEAAGYDIVRLRLMGGQRRRLQIMAERPDGHMDVEDCTRLSRAVSEVLDAVDPIKGEYLLEVSTPGIDRPLTRLKDFDAYEGYEIRLELDRIAEGRKRFRGQLAGTEGENIGINLEEEPDTTVYLPFAWIVDAKLALTDALLKKGAEERAARLANETPDNETDPISSEDEE
jgi:ribosome maturation factor RimP